ncbi:DNA polymerase III subunit beta [Flavilitoribacter nigricans]|uniref:Beta sliding clamp n=1 Tax=Flavilitoribacter nigricans (strain ATCC 23147 / DSM 23189 / NBRC 102662 / NCIMB 1420 / SS-2) TaxID=1122177 RepID=A0A2D0N3I1_FLAN2|nr:DNA polymerase III subunit beta [Flavilitoribacter nigricans]PHN03064.1 DNA polymerase III subunit beta [Flavilitoribacter nigricans DSM 23189 = NBRC 102662]
MKFSVSSSELLKYLQVVGGAIASNPVLPIMEDFLFTISDNQLTIAATDLETSITTSIEVMADSDGMVAIPAKILLETLKALPEQPITFNINDENFGIEITSAFGKYRLAGENGQDFPRIPEPDTVDTVTVAASTIGQGITKTLFATSNDELRPAMTGVYFQIDFGKIIMVATDAHKLVKYTFSDVSSEVSTSFIVPKKALNLLKNALPGGGEVKMSFNKSNAFFSFENTNLVCRLIDSRYPDYNAVIPVDNPNILSVSRTDFQNSLKRIAIYANKTTNQVILNINDGSLTISAQDLDFSNEATEQLACTYDGDQLDIGFNAKFLIEMLGVLESDEVKMELATASRAGILLPVDEVDGEEILMLVMPVMLSN